MGYRKGLPQVEMGGRELPLLALGLAVLGLLIYTIFVLYKYPPHTLDVADSPLKGLAPLAKKEVREGFQSDLNEVFVVEKSSAAAMNFNASDAVNVCSAFGATVATFAQVDQARQAGADRCSCSYINDGRAVYTSPFNLASGCGGGAGTIADAVRDCGKAPIVVEAPGVHCFGVKPSQTNAMRTMGGGRQLVAQPFNGATWGQRSIPYLYQVRSQTMPSFFEPTIYTDIQTAQTALENATNSLTRILSTLRATNQFAGRAEEISKGVGIETAKDAVTRLMRQQATFYRIPDGIAPTQVRDMLGRVIEEIPKVQPSERSFSTTTAQFIRIMPDNRIGTNDFTWLQLSQIMVMGHDNQNYALDPMTKVSASGFHPASSVSSSNLNIVVDGTYFPRAAPNIWHSNTNDPNVSFIELDLGSPKDILYVVYIGRRDTANPHLESNRNLGVRIQLLDKNRQLVLERRTTYTYRTQVIHTSPDAINTLEERLLNYDAQLRQIAYQGISRCKGVERVRTVRIIPPIDRDNVTNAFFIGDGYLNFSQIEIYDINGNNVALPNKTATGSSTFDSNSGAASVAVDGRREMATGHSRGIFVTSVDQTGANRDKGSWEVDLGANFEIAYVVYKGRFDLVGVAAGRGRQRVYVQLFDNSRTLLAQRQLATYDEVQVARFCSEAPAPVAPTPSDAELARVGAQLSSASVDAYFDAMLNNRAFTGTLTSTINVPDAAAARTAWRADTRAFTAVEDEFQSWAYLLADRGPLNFYYDFYTRAVPRVNLPIVGTLTADNLRELSLSEDYCRRIFLDSPENVDRYMNVWPPETTGVTTLTGYIRNEGSREYCQLDVRADIVRDGKFIQEQNTALTLLNKQTCATPITPALLSLLPYPTREFVRTWVYNRSRRLVDFRNPGRLDLVNQVTILEPVPPPIDVTKRRTLNDIAQAFYNFLGGKYSMTYIYDIYTLGQTILDIRFEMTQHRGGTAIQAKIDELFEKYLALANSAANQAIKDQAKADYFEQLFKLQEEQSFFTFEPRIMIGRFFYRVISGQIVITGFTLDQRAVTSFFRETNGGLDVLYLVPNKTVYDLSGEGSLNYVPEFKYTLNLFPTLDCTSAAGIRRFVGDYQDAASFDLSGALRKAPVKPWDIDGQLLVSSVLGARQVSPRQCLFRWREDVWDPLTNTKKGGMNDIERRALVTYRPNSFQWYVNELLFDASGFRFLTSDTLEACRFDAAEYVKLSGPKERVALSRLRGRYVRLRPRLDDTDNFLTLAQVVVSGPTGINLAAGKVVTSSVGRAGFSNNTVPVNGSMVPSSSSFWHADTNNSTSEFWQVDLGSVQEIATVRIIGRAGCCFNRNKNVRIQILDGTSQQIFEALTPTESNDQTIPVSGFAGVRDDYAYNGLPDGLSPCPAVNPGAVFDTSLYLAANPSLTTTPGADAFRLREHYQTTGIVAGLPVHAAQTIATLAQPVQIEKGVPYEDQLETKGACPPRSCADPDVLYAMVDDYNALGEDVKGAAEANSNILRVTKAVTASPFECHLEVDLQPASGPIVKTTMALLVDPNLDTCRYELFEAKGRGSGTMIQANTPALYKPFVYTEAVKEEQSSVFQSTVDAVVKRATDALAPAQRAIMEYRGLTYAAVGDIQSLEGCPAVKCSDPHIMTQFIDFYEARQRTMDTLDTVSRIGRILRAGTSGPLTCDYTFELESVSLDPATGLPQTNPPRSTVGARVNLTKGTGCSSFAVRDFNTNVLPSPPWETISAMATPLFTANDYKAGTVNFVNRQPVRFLNCESDKAANLIAGLADNTGLQRIVGIKNTAMLLCSAVLETTRGLTTRAIQLTDGPFKELTGAAFRGTEAATDVTFLRRGTGGTLVQSCSRLPEVFGVSGAHNQSDGEAVCARHGARMANAAELNAAFNAGMNLCACGWTSDAADRRYPINNSRAIGGCGGLVPSMHFCGGGPGIIYCFGNKPARGTDNILPFDDRDDVWSYQGELQLGGQCYTPCPKNYRLGTAAGACIFNMPAETRTAVSAKVDRFTTRPSTAPITVCPTGTEQINSICYLPCGIINGQQSVILTSDRTKCTFLEWAFDGFSMYAVNRIENRLTTPRVNTCGNISHELIGSLCYMPCTNGTIDTTNRTRCNQGPLDCPAGTTLNTYDNNCYATLSCPTGAVSEPTRNACRAFDLATQLAWSVTPANANVVVETNTRIRKLPTAARAWDTMVRSTTSFPASQPFSIRFKNRFNLANGATGDSYAMLGLFETSTSTTENWRDFVYSLYPWRFSNTRIHENGVIIGSDSTLTTDTNTEFEIRYTGTAIEYYIGATRIREVARTSTAPLFVGVTLWSLDSMIFDIYSAFTRLPLRGLPNVPTGCDGGELVSAANQYRQILSANRLQTATITSAVRNTATNSNTTSTIEQRTALANRDWTQYAVNTTPNPATHRLQCKRNTNDATFGNVMIGYTQTVPPSRTRTDFWQDFTHAFYFMSGIWTGHVANSVSIFENGNSVLNLPGTYPIGTDFTIEYIGSSVVYSVDGRVVRIIAASFTTPYYTCINFYGPGTVTEVRESVVLSNEYTVALNDEARLEAAAAAGTTTIQSVANTARFMGFSGTPVNGSVATLASTGLNFRFTTNGTIQETSSSRCLDFSNTRQNIGFWDCHNGSNQQWRYNPTTKQIFNAVNRYCLQVVNSEIVARACTSGVPAQQWNVSKAVEDAATAAATAESLAQRCYMPCSTGIPDGDRCIQNASTFTLTVFAGAPRPQFSLSNSYITVPSNTGTGGWGTCTVHSSESSSSPIGVQFRPTTNTEGRLYMGGLSINPFSFNSFDAVDFGWYVTGVGLNIIERGRVVENQRGIVPNYSPSTVLEVRFTGSAVEYVADGVIYRSTPLAQTAPLYAYFTFNGHPSGYGVSNIYRTTPGVRTGPESVLQDPISRLNITVTPNQLLPLGPKSQCAARPLVCVPPGGINSSSGTLVNGVRAFAGKQINPTTCEYQLFHDRLAWAGLSFSNIYYRIVYNQENDCSWTIDSVNFITQASSAFASDYTALMARRPVEGFADKSMEVPEVLEAQRGRKAAEPAAATAAAAPASSGVFVLELEPEGFEVSPPGVEDPPEPAWKVPTGWMEGTILQRIRFQVLATPAGTEGASVGKLALFFKGERVEIPAGTRVEAVAGTDIQVEAGRLGMRTAPALLDYGDPASSWEDYGEQPAVDILFPAGKGVEADSFTMTVGENPAAAPVRWRLEGGDGLILHIQDGEDATAPTAAGGQYMLYPFGGYREVETAKRVAGQRPRRGPKTEVGGFDARFRAAEDYDGEGLVRAFDEPAAAVPREWVVSAPAAAGPGVLERGGFGRVMLDDEEALPMGTPLGAFDVAGAAAGAGKQVKFLRFKPVATREAGAGSICAGDFTFFNGEEPVDQRGMRLSNPLGSWKGVGEWVDKNKSPLVFAFAEPVRVTGYSWAVSSLVPAGDPVRWKLEGSPNGVFWELLDDRSTSDQYVPKARGSKTAMFVLGGGVAPRPF